jgi:hypothetical protein
MLVRKRPVRSLSSFDSPKDRRHRRWDAIRWRPIGSVGVTLAATLLHCASPNAWGVDENLPVKNEMKQCHATALARSGPSVCCMFFFVGGPSG